MPFDFAQVLAPFRMQPGLRRIASPRRQLTPSNPGARHLREKMAVLASRVERALAAVPGLDAEPLFAALAAEADLDVHPGIVREGPFAYRAPRLGWVVREGEVEPVAVPRHDQVPAAHPRDAAIGALLESVPRGQRIAALLCLAFEEDFAWLDGRSTIVPWLAVCLPSRWAPEDKVGHSFAAIHAPVADNAMLLAASESLAQLVTAGERWERFVWTISADPRLDQHPARRVADWPAARDPAIVFGAASFRQEHQTFIPFGDRQAVFTIHVDSAPLAAALTNRDDALRLHAALQSMSPAVLAYRGLAQVRDPLLEGLAAHAALLSAGST